MHTRPNLHGRGCRDAARPTLVFLCRFIPASLSTACPWEAWISLRSQKSGSSSSQHSPAPRKPAGQCQGTQLLLPVWTGQPQPRMADRVPSQTLRGSQHSWAPCWPLLYLDTRRPPVWGPSLMQHPLSQSTLIWFGCLLSSMLSEGPPDWVSDNGQGPGGKAAG